LDNDFDGAYVIGYVIYCTGGFFEVSESYANTVHDTHIAQLRMTFIEDSVMWSLRHLSQSVSQSRVVVFM